MRKIYLAVVMALSATVAGVANNTPLKHVGRILPDATNSEKAIVCNPSKAPSLDAQTIKNIATKISCLQKAPLSRAEQTSEVNLTDYTIWTFLDPLLDYNEEPIDNSIDIYSSTQTIMHEVGDSIEINWYYYTNVNFMYKFYVTLNEDGNHIIKLGQHLTDESVYYTDSEGKRKECNIILAGGFLDLDSDPNNPQIILKDTGEVTLYQTTDPNLISMDVFCLYVLLVDVYDSSDISIFNMLINNALCKPNATLGYQHYTYNDNNEPVIENVCNHVYYSFAENYYPNPNDPNTFFDSYFVSNVTPYSKGLGVKIARFEVEEMYSPSGFLWMAYHQPAFPSQREPDGTVTGNLYMNSAYIGINNNGEEDLIFDTNYPMVTFSEDKYIDINGTEYLAFYFPNDVPDLNEDILFWGLTSWQNGFCYDYYAPGVIVFDFIGDAFTGEPDTNGIQDVIQDTYEGAPEYYDLQGIKVANPAPGKIYIVKEGSKVTKRIF